MKTMKSVLTIAFLVICSLGFAQPGGGGQQGPQQGPPPVPNARQIEKMVNSLAEDLSLSDTQKEQVSAIYTAHFKTVKEKLSGNDRPERSEMEALDKKLEEKVSALLTKAQTSQYKTWLKKQSSQRPSR
ncbi:hypothetical protein ACT3CD_10345 [Geofilum sp. OHC36d9]|uniref:hypothetical protein n=1 Tax=Geofilum sp. OHC36d9 TaxID=3458413 RepID=UPI004034D904